MRDLDLHLARGSLGKPEPTCQAVCRSDQPFCRVRDRDRPTDHAIPSL